MSEQETLKTMADTLIAMGRGVTWVDDVTFEFDGKSVSVCEIEGYAYLQIVEGKHYQHCSIRDGRIATPGGFDPKDRFDMICLFDEPNYSSSC